jgi:DNA-binding ferritin-like protein
MLVPVPTRAVSLNRRLADAIDLQLQSRQAYWMILGPMVLQ